MRIFVVASLVIGTFAGTNMCYRSIAAGRQMGGYGAIRDPIGQRLETALGIKFSTADFTSPYAKAMAAYLARSPLLKKRVRDLVEAVIHGANTLPLYRLRVRVSNVASGGHHLKDPRWHYGSPSEENSLAKYILGQAVAMARVRPDLAARYAKAALVCFHSNYFDTDDALLGLELARRNFGRLADLNHRQRHLLRRFYERRFGPGRLSAVYSSRIIVNLAVLQSGFVGKKSVDAARLAHFLRVSSEALRHPNASPILLYTVMAIDWQVLNVARLSGDLVAKGRITAFFDRAKASDARPWVCRWARQALSEKGRMPLTDVMSAPPEMVHPPGARGGSQHH